jgi:hypothetical protein
MKSVHAVLLIAALAMAMTAGAADYEGEADGPWIYMDTINITDEFEGDYLDYLGKGYVAVLEAVKSEGIILDYGVMVKFTGKAGEGDVVIWWAIDKLGDIERVYDRLGTLAEEMYTDTELVELMQKMSKIREPESTDIYRTVTWTPIE